MTSIKVDITNKLGGPDQVGIRMRCAHNAHAEAARRELIQRFGQVSRLMTSTHPEYTHFVYAQASSQDVEQIWPEIEQAAQVALATAPTGAATRTGHGAPQNGLEPLARWQPRFGRMLNQLRSEIKNPAAETQELSLEFVQQRIADGESDAVEALLLQPGTTLRPESVLRALVTLYSQTNQPEKIVALYETRREDMLALPVSRILVEQLMDAYLQYAARYDISEALVTVRQIAQVFLPELERLQQADGVRERLHQALNGGLPVIPALSSLPSVGPIPIEIQAATEPEARPLSEQLAELLLLSPSQQLGILQVLWTVHQTEAVAIQLGDAYAALGRIDEALTAYATVEQSDTTLGRQARLLLSQQRFSEVIACLPKYPESPFLGGLLGAANYWLENIQVAVPLLEAAWKNKHYDPLILLPLARGSIAVGKESSALAPYQMILETAPEMLAAHDIAALALGLYANSDAQAEAILPLCERYVELDGPRRCPSATTADMLELRVTLARAADLTILEQSFADYLDWSAQFGPESRLNRLVDEIQQARRRQQLSHQQHCQILEVLEVYLEEHPWLIQLLVNAYSGILIDELNTTLRKNQPLPPYVTDLRRALLLLDRTTAMDLEAEIEREYQVLRDAQIPVPVEPAAPVVVNLAPVRLALVGGHDATRREVLNTLRSDYGLLHAVEMPPATQGRVDRASVLERIGSSNLIVVITGYLGHDLSGIVSDLHKQGVLNGDVLWLNCRGKSGVVREIIAWIEARRMTT